MNESESSFILSNAIIIDGIGDKPIVNHHLLVNNGLIEKLITNDELTGFKGIQQINCSGKFIIPGLIDSHIHFFQSGGLFTRPDGLDLRHIKSYEEEFEDIKKSIPDLFKRYIGCGVTGVIDCGGPFWNFNVKEQAEAVKIAPHVAVAGPLVSTVSREKLDIGDPPIIQATSEEDARAQVRNCVKYQPIFIKLWFIFNQERFEEDSLIMKAAIDEAITLNLRVAVHATELETARRAVQYGAHILVHSVFQEKVDAEFVQLLLDNEVIYIPTLMVRLGYFDTFRCKSFLPPFEQKYGDRWVIESLGKLSSIDKNDIPEPYRQLTEKSEESYPDDARDIMYHNLRVVYEAGVSIATGTDAGNVGTLHGVSIHREMQMMEEAGMKPIDIIKASTHIGSLILGKKDTGKLTLGNQADLVVLNSNPLESISNTTDILIVYKGGIGYKPEELVKTNVFS